MIFAEATIETKEYGIEKIRICSVEDEFNTDITPMCIFYESDMAKMIMRAATEEELPCFFLNEKDEIIYKLVKYECVDEEALYNEYRRKIARKITISRNQEIYIYKTKCSCGKCYSQYGFDNLELYKAIVNTVKNEKVTVAINLFHCRRCGKFFAEEREIRDIEKKYGLLSIRKRYDVYYYYGYNELEDNNTFRKESFLKERGYNSHLSTEKRRKIILELIEEDERNIYRILQHLQWLINFNGIVNTQAQMVWESDWKFLNDYVRERNNKNLYVE